MIKISVIVPCYNAEQTIERCAQSLFAQTISPKQLEIIFVNDGSSDATEQKLLEIEKKRPNQVIVINQEENKRQGAARNAGISYASGDYIGFLDSDDYVTPDMYEKLANIAEQFSCDMAGGGCVNETIEENGSKKLQEVKDPLPKGQLMYTLGKEEKKQLILLGTSVSFAARIYRKKMLEEQQLYFPEGIFYEDNYWQCMTLLAVKSYYIMPDCFYHYVHRNDSSSGHVTCENLLQSMQVQNMILEKERDLGVFYEFSAEFLAKYYKSYSVMNLLAAYLQWQKIPDSIYEPMYEQIHQFGKLYGFENPYLWKADCGLLKDLFAEKRCGFERALCMEQYKNQLQAGTILQWTPIFAPESEAQQVHHIWKEYQKKCFLLGKYAKEYQNDNTFMERAAALLNEAEQIGFTQDAAAFMEQMISHQGEYAKRCRNDAPILVYRGDATCYSVLDAFAECFINALKKEGIAVEVYDIEKKGAEGLLELIGKTYRAIVGFQTWLFSVHLDDGRNVHDCINAPCFHFIFDHPLWLKEHLEQGPKEYYIFTHGKDYQKFVRRYLWKQITQCELLPPAGFLNEDMIFEKEIDVSSKNRPLDVTFIGTWYDYRERIAYIKNTKGFERYLANRFLLIMRKNPNLPAEDAFSQALSYYGISLNDTDYKQVLFEMKQVCFAVMTYYREKIIKYLLDAGIQIHVYGDSWKKSPLSGHKNLICHAQVNCEESMEVWKQSKISLNIMSWHKGGFTERIANMLLCGTAAVSDKSLYLTEHFKDGDDIVLFDLKEPHKLAERVKEVLSNETLRQSIAKAGMEKGLCEHTWKQRTQQFLKLLKETELY